MPTTMEVAIQDEKLRIHGDYIEYHVPSRAGQGPPVTILANPPGEGNIAILFIPKESGIHIPPNFLINTVALHWQTLGSHIQEFVFYSFDPRVGDPWQGDNAVIPNLGSDHGNGNLAYAQEYIQMSCFNSSALSQRTRGMKFTAEEEAREMGCIEGDGLEMLKGVDEEIRARCMRKLKLNEKWVSDRCGIKMRAIFEENLKAPLALLPYTVRLGSVWIKPICLYKTCRDWRHMRRVLFRSLHDRFPDRFLSVYCKVEDEDFIQFLYSCGYEDLGCNFWVGEFSR